MCGRAALCRLDASKNVGWLREIPEPYEPEDDKPESLERSVIERDEYMKDEGEVRMLNIEDLCAGAIEHFVRSIPALWEESAMREP